MIFLYQSVYLLLPNCAMAFCQPPFRSHCETDSSSSSVGMPSEPLEQCIVRQYHPSVDQPSRMSTEERAHPSPLRPTYHPARRCQPQVTGSVDFVCTVDPSVPRSLRASRVSAFAGLHNHPAPLCCASSLVCCPLLCTVARVPASLSQWMSPASTGGPHESADFGAQATAARPKPPPPMLPGSDYLGFGFNLLRGKYSTDSCTQLILPPLQPSSRTFASGSQTYTVPQGVAVAPGSGGTMTSGRA